MIGESIEESDKWKITDTLRPRVAVVGDTASYKTQSIWGRENVRLSWRQDHGVKWCKVSCSSFNEMEKGGYDTMIKND